MWLPCYCIRACGNCWIVNDAAQEEMWASDCRIVTLPSNGTSAAGVTHAVCVCACACGGCSRGVFNLL